MNILKLLKARAVELLQDYNFLKNRDQYSCTQMSTYAIAKAMESGEVYSCVYTEVEELQDKFRTLLREDSMATIGYELPPNVIEELDRPYCPAFVHVVCYDENDEEYTGEEYTDRFVAARIAWLQFIIEQES